MSIVKHKRGSVSALSAQHEAELKALANKPDDDIDYSDIPVTEDELWSEAHRGKFFRPLKTQASVRIDADVMEWLKRRKRISDAPKCHFARSDAARAKQEIVQNMQGL